MIEVHDYELKCLQIEIPITFTRTAVIQSSVI